MYIYSYYSSYYSSTTNRFTLANNNFRDNAWFHSVTVDVASPRYPHEISIIDNRFENNTGDAIIRLTSSSVRTTLSSAILANFFGANVVESTILLEGTNRPEIHQNTFAASQATSELHISIVNDESPLNATLNFWGNLSTTEVDEMIFDLLDDIDLEQAVYFPYLIEAPLHENDGAGDASGDDGSGNDDQGGAVQNGCFQGGWLRGLCTTSLELPSRAAPYVISGNVIVDAGVLLEIEAGAVFSVAPNASVYVRGSLAIGGNVTAPVVFDCASTSAFDPMERLGCYPRPSSHYFTPSTPYLQSASLTHDSCADFCRSHHAPIAYIYSNYRFRQPICECSDDSLGGAATEDSSCESMDCPGNSTQPCGALYHVKYQLAIGTGACRRWGGVVFVKGGAEVDTQSYMRHTVLQNAGGDRTRNWPAIALHEHPVPLTNVRIENATSDGVVIGSDGTSASTPHQIEHLTAFGCGGAGIRTVGQGCGGGCHLAEVNVSNNAQGGLVLNMAAHLNSANVTIVRSTFDNNHGEAGVYITGNPSGSQSLLHRVTLIDTSASGNFNHGVCATDVDIAVLDCALDRNGHGVTDFGFKAVMRTARSSSVVLHGTRIRRGMSGASILSAGGAAAVQSNVDVSNNQIAENIGQVALEIRDRSTSSYYLRHPFQVSVQGNTVENNSLTTSAVVFSFRSEPTVPFDVFISNNDMIANHASVSVLSVSTSSTAATTPERLRLSGNTILGNVLSSELIPAVSVTGFGAVFESNFFVNPNQTAEMGAETQCSPCTDSVNASHNWWGRPDDAFIATRIIDDRDIAGLPRINTAPHMLTAAFDCSSVANCSDIGVCARPQICSCPTGFGGADCGTISCDGVSYCHAADAQAGTCVGPNMCECADGWQSDDCGTPVCEPACANGICTEPDRCTCFAGWAGTSCAECHPEYASATCDVSCPDCGAHGSCDAGLAGSGLCLCIDGFVGELCDGCNSGRFGTQCEHLAATSTITPSSGLDTGGGFVSLTGHNFMNVSVYSARWDSRDVQPCHFRSESRLVCAIPPIRRGLMTPATVVVALLEDGQQVRHGSPLSFGYRPLCPGHQCLHGYCSQGACACMFGFQGDDCSERTVQPMFVNGIPSDLTLEEGELFASTPFVDYLSQGTPPLRWSIAGAPSDMVLHSTALRWSAPDARPAPYSVTISVQNSVGSASVTLSIRVPASYTAEVDYVGLASDPAPPIGSSEIPVELVLVPGESVLFRGRAVGNRSSGLTDVPLDLWLSRPGFSPYKVAIQTSVFGYWRRYWNFGQHMAGRYTVGVSHPAETDALASGASATLGPLRQHTAETWSVLFHNLRASNPRPVYGYPGVYVRTFAVTNPGDVAVTGVSVSLPEWIYDEEGVMVSVDVHNTTIGPQSSTTVTVELNMTAPYFSATVPITVSCNEVVNPVYASARLRIEDREPRLSLSPSSFSQSVERGSQERITVVVRNVGAAATGTLLISIVDNPALTLASTSSVIQSIAAGGSSSFDVLVAPSAREEISRTSGSIAIGNSQVGARFSYSVNIVSSALCNLTVAVEDEITYFGPDQLGVAGARVRITSADGLRYSGTANLNGSVTFENIPESFYTIRVSAPSHAQFQELIRLRPPGTTVRAFIARQAVSYEWTVTPVAITETYTFTVAATFVTHVPMPVVTIDPIAISMDRLETEVAVLGSTSYSYVITNHGLIAADAFAFELPRNHPFLEFSYHGPIGDIPANSSIVVPVSVTQRPGRSRRGAGGCYVGLGTYSVECGGTQYTSLGLTFSDGDGGPCRNPPPPPPGPPGPPSGGGGGCVGWRGCGGNGEGSTRVPVVFKAVTFCDNCVKAVFVRT